MSDQEIRATALPLPGNGWQGVLAKGESIIWRCEHYHIGKFKAQHIPNGRHISEYPEKRSAVGCATVELCARQEAAKLEEKNG